MELLSWLRARWDRALGFALVVLGAVLVLLAYRGVSEATQVVEELSYLISGGLAGLLAMGVGVGLLICADLGDEFRMLDRVEARLRAEQGEGPLPPDDQPPEEEEEMVILDTGHGDGARRNHTADGSELNTPSIPGGDARGRSEGLLGRRR
jgi:hypothetical protein